MTCFVKRVVSIFGGVVLGAVALAGCSNSDEPAVQDEAPNPTLVAEDIAPIAEPDAPAFVGVWAADTAWCGITPGSADPGPVVFTEGEFLGYENICRIGYAAEGTEGGFRLEMICEAEGVEYTDVVDVEVDGDILRMRRGDEEEVLLNRC